MLRPESSGQNIWDRIVKGASSWFFGLKQGENLKEIEHHYYLPNYFLKETEKDSKNFLGQYGSQRMTDWKEILGLYEKENIFLAEASQLLIQAVVYEIPGFKKQITKVTLNKLITHLLYFLK